MAPNSPSALQLHDDAAPDGTFSIQNVPPGPYTLTAMLPMIRPDLPTSGTFGVSQAAMREQMLNNVPETAALPIVVAGEDISGVSLRHSTRRPHQGAIRRRHRRQPAFAEGSSRDAALSGARPT